MSKIVEVSLCKFCNSITNTIRVPALSASENKHYRYECGKCGCKKELEIIRKVEELKKLKRGKKNDE